MLERHRQYAMLSHVSLSKAVTETLEQAYVVVYYVLLIELQSVGVCVPPQLIGDLLVNLNRFDAFVGHRSCTTVHKISEVCKSLASGLVSCYQVYDVVLCSYHVRQVVQVYDFTVGVLFRDNLDLQVLLQFSYVFNSSEVVSAC